MKEIERNTQLAILIFNRMEDEIELAYGKKCPFVMIYVHEKAEMLTNIRGDQARKLIKSALNRIETETPNDLSAS